MSTANSVVAPRLAGYFDEYLSFHQNPINKRYHFLGLPILTIAIPGLLSKVLLAGPPDSMLRVDLGLLLVVGVSLWYFWLDWKIGVPFALLGMGLFFALRPLNGWIFAAMFVIGWIFQFIGHIKYEKKSPAFTKNFEHLFIGPIWAFSHWVGYSK